jgi:uncharacterized protein (DUF305 family)
MRRQALMAAAVFAAGLALGGSLELLREHVVGGEHASEAARTAAPGPVDVGFAQFMQTHHEQAVVMAQILLGHGNSKLASLARSIQEKQLIEIGQMKGWLQLWNKPLLPTTSSMDWMLLGRVAPDDTVRQYVLDCRSAPGGMPGLATSDQLNQLRHLDGIARDRLFLQLMTAHHRSALVMARFAAINAETPAVRNLATQMTMAQGEELSLMMELARAEGIPVPQ